MDERLKQMLQTGRELYEKREYDKAEPYLREVGAAMPGFADVQNMLGVIHHHQGKYDLSRRAFEKALKVNPRYTEAALNLAVTYNELGKYAEAKEVYERVVDASRSGPKRLDPFARGKIANMHAALARAYEDIRMFDEAIREYSEALALCPEFADLRTRLGHARRDSGDIAAAVEEYAKALEAKPDYVPALVHLGVSLFALGQKKEAIVHWERALELDPGNRVAITYLRMVTQLSAQEDAEAEGVPIDVRHEEGSVAARAQEEAEKRTLYRPLPDAPEDAEYEASLDEPVTEAGLDEPVTSAGLDEPDTEVVSQAPGGDDPERNPERGS